MTAQDAQLAVEHGAAGVIVSNHGGRQLDTILSGADAVAPIVDAVAGRIDVLVDGGIRRGTDVVKALALGARAVMVGRPLTWGLVVAGAQGAQRVIEILLAELVNALALVGCPRAAELDRGFVDTGALARPRARGAGTLNVLVTGVTGYIGSLMVPRLAGEGHTVRGFARHPERVTLHLPVVAGDAVSGAGLERALEGIEVAYFLIHSMEPSTQDPFADRERAAAERFAAAAAAAGVRRIVYLGGLVPAGRSALAPPGQPDGGGGDPDGGGPRHGGAARLDRDRRAIPVVPLPGTSGRTTAGAGHPGLATAPHRAHRRA